MLEQLGLVVYRQFSFQFDHYCHFVDCSCVGCLYLFVRNVPNAEMTINSWTQIEWPGRTVLFESIRPHGNVCVLESIFWFSYF